MVYFPMSRIWTWLIAVLTEGSSISMNAKNSIILILIISGLITLFLSIISIKKTKVKGSFFFFLMMISVCGYSLGYAFELYNSTLQGIMMALKVQYLTIAYIPAFWFFLAAAYSGYINLTRFTHYLPFLIVPLISQILVMTAEHNALYYINPRLETVAPFTLIRFDKGIWYYVQLIYSNLMLLAGSLLFGRLMIFTSGKHRDQAIIAFVASLIPWSGNIIYTVGRSPFGLDLTPLFLSATGILFALAIFRYQMFDLTPVARSRIFDIMSDPVMVFDDEYRLADLNKSARVFLGLYGDKPIGESSDRLFAEYGVLRDQIRGNNPNCCDIKKGYGPDAKYYRSRVEPMLNSSEKLLGKLVILNDNTAEQLLITKLNQIATTDELTGVNNRRNLMDLCSQEIARSKRNATPLSVMMIDLDFFKKINDTYGHPCGDETLRRTAAVFQRNLREGDILGRYGGEEFIIMLHHSSSKCAYSTAERYRKSVIDEEILFDGQKIPVSVSIGLSCYSGRGDTNLESLIHQADSALYKAKKAGRNRVEFF